MWFLSFEITKAYRTVWTGDRYRWIRGMPMAFPSGAILQRLVINCFVEPYLDLFSSPDREELICCGVCRGTGWASRHVGR